MKKLFLILSWNIICFSLFSQNTISEKEIRKAKKVEFNNRVNEKAPSRYKVENEELGKEIAKNIQYDGNKQNEKSVVNASRIPPNGKELGADILVFTEKSKFGHINSIQRILSGYVQEAFRYSEKDSTLIAKYVLYYNAMHRNDLDYFQKRFNPSIKTLISKEGAGISTDYKDWSGNTEIVIPIETSSAKQKGEIGLDELEDEVEKILKNKKDSSIDKKKFSKIKDEKKIREKIAEYKLRKDKEANSKNSENKKSKLENELIELKKDPKKNEKIILAIEKEISELEVSRKKSPKNTEESKTSNSDSKKSAKDKKSSKEEILTKREDDGTDDKTSKSKNDSISDSRIEKEETYSKLDIDPEELLNELNKAKDELAKKEALEKQREEFSPSIIEGKIPFIRTLNLIEGECTNEIHLLDPAKDDFVFKGNFNRICGKNFKIFAGNILVVGTIGDGERLVLLSHKNLKPSGKSEVFVYNKTILEISDGYLYATEKDNGRFYLSKFDSNLKRILRSEKEISAETTLIFYGEKIYTTGKGENGQTEIKIFTKEDLKFIKKFGSETLK
ncbi:MAG: P83/100 family protein [Leptospiraceae bacterium]|nr:P83/100 family protein [Leptospiraceae bacterium]